jgi:carbon-monoxide dehydrogenase large subunit
MANAADHIVEKGRRIAAVMLEVSEADIEFARQRFVVKGTDRSVGLFEAAAAALGTGLPSDLRGKLIGISDQVMSLPSFAYTCAVCEVEIDPETGIVDIVRYTSIDDCGRAVNPMLIHGQSHGGIAQGVGQALWEECVYDRDSAQLLSGSLMDYTMPRADGLPLFQTEISEVPSTTNPLGMRGGSEGGITPGLAAVANAIVDALAEFGVEHIELPATPERIWRAIRNAPQPTINQRDQSAGDGAAGIRDSCNAFQTGRHAAGTAIFRMRRVTGIPLGRNLPILLSPIGEVRDPIDRTAAGAGETPRRA